MEIYLMLTIENALVLIAAGLFARAIVFVLRAEKAVGVVVELVEDGEETLYAPIVEFNADGRVIRFLEMIYENPPYAVGTRVTVLYPPKNPQKARIGRFTALFLIPSLFAVAAVLAKCVKPFISGLENL